MSIASVIDKHKSMRREKHAVSDVNDTRLITMLEGKLFLVENGNFILLTSPVILGNGTIISMEGLMKIPGGAIRKLREGEYV
jgi:hypothetical protein